jgi:hypothetical protein
MTAPDLEESKSMATVVRSKVEVFRGKSAPIVSFHPVIIAPIPTAIFEELHRVILQASESEFCVIARRSHRESLRRSGLGGDIE